MERVAPRGLWPSIFAALAALAPAPAGAEDPGRPPEVWAVVVGVDNAPGGVPDCREAVRDSVRVARWFTDVAGWGQDHVLLINDLGTRAHGEVEGRSGTLLPTRENLDWAITRWLPHRIRPGDVAVVYFAGQAVGLPPSPEAPPGSPGREYLLPIDANEADLDATAWALDEAVEGLASRGENTILCWLDTSPMGRGARTSAADHRPDGLRLLARLARWRCVSAWLAGDGRPAAEPKNAGSPFRATLLDALGTPEAPRGLHACLSSLSHDGRLADQGFRTLGGLPPGLSLWPRELRRGTRPARPELVLQRGHAAGVSAAALSADGTVVISAGEDSTVRIWRAKDWTLLRVLTYHRAGVAAMALAPDGRRLASGDGAGRVRFWDLELQREIPLDGPQPHDAGIVALEVARDGRHFATLDSEGRAYAWDASRAAIGRPQEFAGGPFTALAGGAIAEPVAFATAGLDGRLRAHRADGTKAREWAMPGGRPVEAIRLSPGGRFLAVADSDGRVVVLPTGGGPPIVDRTLDGPAAALALDEGRRLAAATRSGVFLLSLEGDAPTSVLDLSPGPASRVEMSADGRWIAYSIGGAARAIRLDDLARPRVVDLGEDPGDPSCLALAPDGRALVAGDVDGGLRGWDLETGLLRGRMPAQRGMVQQVDVSTIGKSRGRFLVGVDRDGQAVVWDLEQADGARPIPGIWSSGAILPDGSALALCARPDDPDRGGEVVLVDRATGRLRPTVFELPPDVDPRARPVFERLLVSRDGRRVAAAGGEGRPPLACVWDAETGRLVAWGRGKGGPVTALSLSADGHTLLVADGEGVLRSWMLPEGAGGPPRELTPEGARSTLRIGRGDDGEDSAITATQASPARPNRVAIGTRGGRILLGDLDAGTVELLGDVDGQVNTVAFTEDGRRLLAGGEDKLLRIWALGPRPEPIPVEPREHHSERVNALVAWPGGEGQIMVSAGDDSTVRFWQFDERGGVKLLGTLSATLTTPGPDGRPARLDWVAYTPDGHYDASFGGEDLLRWRDGDSVVTMDQVRERYHRFGLGDQIRHGRRPETVPLGPPPADLAIDLPTEPVTRRREVELVVSLGQNDPESLRLYFDGVPVRTAADFREAGRPGRYTTRVRLRPGVHRIYAMASRPGGIDSRSEDVEIRYEGTEPRGRLHVVALGVGGYRRRALRYAEADAERVATFLQERGFDAAERPGERIVLLNDDVTEENIERAFSKLRADTSGRPEDTVVVFLAGHTDILDDRFCLLLPSFPFSDDAPALVATRGNQPRPGGERKPAEGEPTSLPYSAIYNHLVRLDALQRLVIVDACQAEAIFDDPGVRRLEEYLDRDTRRGRTEYLLAARRGELAGEEVALRHGLLTYTLLKGLGATGLQPLPERIGAFAEFPTADLDGDGTVTTAELREFVDRALPPLAAAFPALVVRGERGQAPDQRLRLRSAEDSRSIGSSFPLINLDPPPTGPESR